MRVPGGRTLPESSEFRSQKQLCLPGAGVTARARAPRQGVTLQSFKPVYRAGREVMDVNLFIFGVGYSGTAIAAELRGFAAYTSGTVRAPRSGAVPQNASVAPLLFDGSSATDAVAAALHRTTHLVTTIAPSGAGDPVLRCCHALIVDAMPALQWIAYLSTTGVYGDHGGDWVNETSACRPASPRSVRRLEVEEEWQQVAALRGVPLAVLRLSGIYGPSRNALASLAAGEARRVVAPGQWFNRIHVADIAGSAALLAREAMGGVFNISDDEPAPPEDVILHAAALMGVAPPAEIPLDSPLVSPALRTFYSSNRRVSNQLIRSRGHQFRYPDYRAGLGAMWQNGDWR
jgi:nucleoside-diphosphate-sugar epimerase